MSQLNELSDHQRQNLTDEVRRTVGSSSVDNLLRYVSEENDYEISAFFSPRLRMVMVNN